MLAAVRAVNLTSRDATMEIISVSKYAGVNVECSAFNQRSRLVTPRRLRGAHPTVSNADAARCRSAL